MVDVICLRGAPSVGKSTVAKALAISLPTGVRLEVDCLRSMRIDACWTHQQQHSEGLEIAADLCISFLARNWRPVIVVDTFSKGKLCIFLDRLASSLPREKVRCFALWSSIEVLKHRISHRPTDRFQDIQVSEAINAESMLPIVAGEKVLDTSSLSPDEIARTIYLSIWPSGFTD